VQEAIAVQRPHMPQAGIPTWLPEQSLRPKPARLLHGRAAVGFVAL